MPPRKTLPYSSPLSKKLRITPPYIDNQCPQQPRHTSHGHIHSPPSKHQTPPKPTAINLSPCHICHRRPTKKTDLDSYADCEGCGERTCYICIRQCLGPRRLDTAASPMCDLMRDDDDHDDHTQDDDDGENRVPSARERSFMMEDAPPVDGDRGAGLDRAKKGGTWGRGEGRGHRRRICSQCCVEQGSEGEVRCLGCLET